MLSYEEYQALLKQSPSVKQPTVPQELVDTIMGVESGGNPNAVSPQGARGRMQVMPATFAQYGDGTPFEQATDEQLQLAALAKLQDDYRYYNGDVAKTAAAYLGGRGAVRGDGTIRNDVADAHGTTPAAYAQMVQNRLGAPREALPEQPVMDMNQHAEGVFSNFRAKYLPKDAGTKPTAAGDAGRLLKMGVNHAASDVRELVGRIPLVGKPVQRGLDTVDEMISGKSSEQLLKDDTEAMRSGLSPEMQAAMQKQWWDEERGTFGDAWKDPRAYAAGVLQSAPETALMMFPAMRFARGTFTAARAAGMTLEQAAKKAASVATLTGSVTEGLLGGAAASRETRDQILAMPDEKLQQSDAIKSLIADGMSFEEAKKAIAEDASTRAFLVAGVADGVFGGMGDRMLSRAITKGLAGNVAMRIVKGAVAEGVLEELPQSYLEKVATNLGVGMVDPSIKPTQGALNEALGGLATGAIMGGGMAAPFAEQADAPTPTPEPAGTTYEQIRQKQIEHIQGQMDLLRREAGVAENNGDIYATPLGEQYQWLEAKLQNLQREDIAADQPETAPTAEPEPDVVEPMRPFAERAMMGYSTEERAQTVAESMSKVQNGQYVVVPHPRLPGKFAVIPAENNVQLPERHPEIQPTQDEISAQLARAAAQAPDTSLEGQMRSRAADQAMRAIEERGGVASPVEAQILQDAGLGQPYDRIDPALGPVERQTQPRERIVYTSKEEERAAEKDRLDALARGEPAPVQPSETEIADQRLQQAAQEAPAPRMDPTEFRLRDAAEEGAASRRPEATTPAGIILPEQRETEHPIPFSEPPAPVTIAGKAVRDMAEGELKTYAASEKPDVAAKAQAELDFRATPAGANEQIARKMTKTPEFKAWFGDSRAVDELGAPVVLYHGTTGDVESFSLGFSGADGVGYDVPAIFATPDANLASDYAANKFDREIADAMRNLQQYKNEHPGEYGPEYEGLYRAVSAAFQSVKEAGRPETSGGANVLPVFMALQNPLEVDAQGRRFMEVMPEKIKEAQAGGYDGLIVRNVVDNASPATNYPAPVYVAFRPEQVKSAIGNRGTFDSKNPSIVNEEAPAGSSLPFGRGWQTHRLAPVTRNAPMVPAIEERVGQNVTLQRHPQDFARPSPTARQQINDVFADLRSLGVPEQVLDGVRNVVLHTPAHIGGNVRARFLTHYTTTGEPIRVLTLARSLMDTYGIDKTIPYQMRGVVLHELAHSFDYIDGQGYLSHTSPLFDVHVDQDGQLVPDGPVMQEALQAYKSDLAEKGPLSDLLAYPLSTYTDVPAGADVNAYKSETFAQLHTLYYLNPSLMQQKFPAGFRLFEEIQNALHDGRGPAAEATGGRGSAGGRGSDSRGQALARAVQGAFRNVAEHSRGIHGRGQQDARVDRGSPAHRQGGPEPAAQQAVEAGRGDLGDGQLAGSNQGYSDTKPKGRRPKNVDDITDAEFEAEIKKIGDRVAGLKSGSTVAEVRAIAKKLEAAAKKGIEGKDWYEKSGYAILAAFHGDTYLAEKFIQAIAITSSGTAVKPNFTAAATAWEQFAAGDPIHVQTNDQDQKLTDLFYFGKDWSGRKTNTFYLNLTEAMRGHDSGFSTQDMHMGNLAFGKKQLTDAQYELLENLTRLVANTKNLNMKPRQLQAAAWVTQKTQHLFDYYRERGWMKELNDKQLREHVRAEALVNYADIAAAKQWIPTVNERTNIRSEQIRPTVQNVTLETIPSDKTHDFQYVARLPLKERAKYSKAILEAAPVERLGALFGFDKRTLRVSPSTGGYGGNISPNFVVEIAPLHIGQPMTSEELARVKAFARALMYVYRQDAVPFFRADPALVPGEEGAQLGIRLVLRDSLTEAKERKLFARLREQFGESAGFTQLADNEIVLVNFRDENGVPFLMQDEAFYEAADRLIDAMTGENPVTEHKSFGVQSEYPYHDWQEDPEGAALLGTDQAGSAGRPDLPARLRAWREEAQAASSAWIAEHQQRIAGSNEEAGLAGRTGSGDIQGAGRGLRVSLRPQKPDGQEVTVIHYSKAPSLTALTGGHYGSGIKGAEAQRLAFDPSIRPRVYFYLDQDTDVLPRPEPGLGSHVYRTTLTNMYPLKEDPAGVFPAIKNIIDPGEKANEMERRIIEAGYDGYVNKGYGMAVVLGKEAVKVQYLGQYDGRGGIREMEGSNFAIPADTQEETLTALVKQHLDDAGVDGNLDLFPLGHSRRVALYATDLGRAMGLNPQELSLLTSSAMLHDIGKVTLPEPVLNKHGKLTEAEHAVIERHASAAEKLLSHQLQTIQTAAAQHHENWDGSGYPNHLAGEQISKYARIIAVADVFDALTAKDRPYKKAWTAKEALKQLREWSGTHFEPGLVDQFAAIAGSNEGEAAPLWYSELSRAVSNIKQASAPAGQWLAMIDNLQTKGIKGDEIEWSGVREWLKLQEGKVTKEQVVQYLQQNGVQIEEAVRGAGSQREQVFDEYRELLQAQEEIMASSRSPEERAAAADEFDRLFEEREQKANATPDDSPKFEQYTLPGGENYRELLLTLPEVRDSEYEGLRKEYMDLATNGFNAQRDLTPEETARMNEIRSKMQGMRKFRQGDQDYRSPHWDQKNILAHVRFDERTDADGKRVLFVQEIQSDWGQQGKRQGFAGGTGTVEPQDPALFNGQQYWTVRWSDGSFSGGYADRKTAQEVANAGKRGTPRAPFVGKTGQWVSLALKRMIRWAADNGFDRIAWTTGEQQAARYDLSKQISEIEYRVKEGAESGKLEAFDKSGERVISREVSTAELPDVIGKEAAERLMKSQGPGYMGSTDRAYVLAGEDLKVGGEGMKDFYDKIVPQAANVLLKKLGGERVGKTKIETADPYERQKLARQRSGITPDEWWNLRTSEQKKLIEQLTDGTTEQHSFDITPAMRETAQQGMPLFAGSNEAMPEWLAAMPQADQDAAKRAGVYLPMQTWQQRLQGLRNGWKERVAQGVFDQFAPVKALDERAYVLDRMTKGADAGLEALLMYGTPYLNSAGALDVRDLQQGGVIQLLSELNGEHDRFLGWIAGNRAHLLKQQGRENNLTDVDISSLRNWNQGAMADGRNRAAVYADVHRRFNQFNKAVLDVAEKAGLINPSERSTWEQDFYVPFYRVLEDQGYEGPRDVGSLVNQYAFKRLRGGKEGLNDLFSNTLRNWNHLLAAALKNQAAKATIEAGERAGIAMPVAGREKGAVSFRDNGKQRWYQIEDPLILDAITSLEYAGIAGGPVMKMMQKAKHYLTFGVTIAPAFKIRNLIRDQISAVGLNPISGNVMGNLGQGWKLTSKDSAQYAHMLAGGGLMRFGTSLEGNRSEHVNRLVKMAGKNTVTTAEQARNLVEKMWDAWQELGDRSENVTRATIYRQVFDKAVKEGKGQDEAHLLASFAARDSMDFGLQGSYAAVRLLSQLVPFFNARLQGLYKIGREGIAPTIRMLAGNAKIGDRAKALRFNAMAAAVSMASVALMLAQEDDPDWQAREDWDRDTYWWIKVGGQAFRIPKPFELGAIGSLAERGVEAMMKGMGPEDRRLFVQRLGWLVTENLSMNIVPQAVKPLVDLYANTNSFTGRPIETEGMEKLSKAERIGMNTSQLAQILGKAGDYTGLSPVQIDSLINGYFSWLGANILWVSDFAMRPAMGAPEKPAPRMDDLPVFGSFVRELPAPQSRYVTLFYENATKFGQLAADIQHYQKLGLTEKAMELAEERGDDVALAKMYQRMQRQMGEINQRMRQVQSSDLSAEEKREALDILTERKNELARLVEEHRRGIQGGR